MNRLAYTLQSTRPHPETGRHYYYRPKGRDGGPPPALTLETLRRHLAGELTLGMYSINPKTQRSKWEAIDADYKNSIEDLLRLQNTNSPRMAWSRHSRNRTEAGTSGSSCDAGTCPGLPGLHLPHSLETRSSDQGRRPAGRN